MDNIKERAIEYLEAHTELNELYGTEDGFLFEQKHDAATHARTLNETDPKVEVFKREKSKRLSPAELKVIKDTKVAEYTEVFGEAPDAKLSASALHKLIEEKKAEDEDNDNKEE